VTPNGSIYHLQALVLKAFSPFTISPVMKAKIESVTPIKLAFTTTTFHLPSEVIFKVYDRRFPYTMKRCDVKCNGIRQGVLGAGTH
jgi:hypothetical protein